MKFKSKEMIEPEKKLRLYLKSVQILPRVILALNGILHLYYGLVFICDPRAMMASLSLSAVNPAGITEMRAFHGGLMLAMGCLFSLATLYRRFVIAGLIMMIVTYVGAVAARITGIILDQTKNALIFQILYIEIAGLILGLVGLWIAKNLETKAFVHDSPF